MLMRLKYRIPKKTFQAKEMMKQMLQKALREHMAGAVPAGADVSAAAREGEAGAGENVSSIPLWRALSLCLCSLCVFSL